FWTISRLYYGNGRYYRALWKANARKYPAIDELHINDVIEIPAIEELDPADIERPQRRQVAAREAEPADGSGGERPRWSPTPRTARTSDGGDGFPTRRPDRATPHLELPIGDPEPAPAVSGRGASPIRPAAGFAGSTATPSSAARARDL